MDVLSIGSLETEKRLYSLVIPCLSRMCRRFDDTECERPQGAPLAQSRRLVWTLCPFILYTEVTAACSVLQMSLVLMFVLPVCRVGHCPGRQVQVYIQLTHKLILHLRLASANARLLNS
jgi:hypothetical protein